MNFRLELQVKPFARKINIRQNILLMGSCFTQHITRQLRHHLFPVLENPHGILFNPLSISTALQDYIHARVYGADQLFFHNELWQSWNHHSQFSHWEQEECLRLINQQIARANACLKNADWLIITLGSSFVYSLKDQLGGGQPGQIVANCHKVPAQHFGHHLSAYSAIENALERIIADTVNFNAGINIIFTISPVRHSREGLVENNRSKALLHSAVHAMQQRHANVQYFPAYELIIDDLRDYRYYAEDLVHPNFQATQYVWEKFCEAVIDEESKAIMKQVHTIQLARQHKPLHQGSALHQNFLHSMLKKTSVLQAQYPFLPLTEAIDYFSLTGMPENPENNPETPL